MKEKIAENAGKIKQNKVLPYLVGNVVEVSLWYGLGLCRGVSGWLVLCVGGRGRGFGSGSGLE
jgi:hypothetical protein